MTRQEAIELLVSVYGEEALDDDPEWTEDTIEFMLEDPYDIYW